MKKSAAVECSEEFRALRNTMEHWKTVAADFAKQVEVKVRQLETAWDDETSLLRELKATRETRDALVERVVEQRIVHAAECEAHSHTRAHLEESKRLAAHYQAAWNVSNSERGTNAIRVKELESELDRTKREHSEEVARLEKKLGSTIEERNALRNQMGAFREIALAAVGVKP